MKKIAFGCDHVGFILKHEIVAHLVERGVEVIDKGTWSSERTDYPHYASQVALAVAGGEADGGILICGTGVGISIAANKFAGIRAVVCSEPYSAQLSRQHNDTNVLAFWFTSGWPRTGKNDCRCVAGRTVRRRSSSTTRGGDYGNRAAKELRFIHYLHG